MHQKSFIKLSLASSALVLLSACAGPAQTTLADGTTATRIECEGTARGLNYCFEKAGKSCGAKGYTIVDEAGQTIGKSDVADAGIQELVREYAESESSLLIKCGV